MPPPTPTDERCGRWILGRVIATGAFAEVRAARRAATTDRTAEPVAIKRLHSHAARDPALAALFALEHTLTTGLPPHPAVVAAVSDDDEGQAATAGGPRPYLAVHRVDGPDLRARLSEGPLVRPAWLAVVAEIAGGVAHLHAHGWVHGDLNPSNILLGPRGAVLCDLGVARPIGDGGPVRGTAAYMAPEQVKGLAWTGAVDVFALGVVLWELAAGARLFARPASYLSMAAVVDTDAPALADRALASLAAAALDRCALARPSAVELAAALAAMRDA